MQIKTELFSSAWWEVFCRTLCESGLKHLVVAFAETVLLISDPISIIQWKQQFTTKLLGMEESRKNDRLGQKKYFYCIIINCLKQFNFSRMLRRRFMVFILGCIHLIFLLLDKNKMSTLFIFNRYFIPDSKDQNKYHKFSSTYSICHMSLNVNIYCLGTGFFSLHSAFYS